jgi:hypothetical protein
VGRLDRLRQRLARGKESAPGDDVTPEEDPEGSDPFAGLERPQLDLDLRETRRAGIRERLRRSRKRTADGDGEAEQLQLSAAGAKDDDEAAGEPELEAKRRRSLHVPAAASGAAVGAWGLITRAAHAVGRAARGAWDYFLHFWLGLSLITRRRILAAAGLATAVLVVVLVIAPLAPCWAPGGDRCPPSDDAVALVPEESDGYIHLNLAEDTDQVEAGRGVAERLPALAAEASALLPLATDRAIEYERDIAPWSGGEVAVVLNAGITGLDRVLLIEVANSEGADAFVESYLRSGVTETDLEGITVRRDARGTAAAISSGFLILGPEPAVTETVEVSRDRAPSLADDPDFAEAESALPDERIADAWISPELAETVFLGPRAELSPFNTFVNADATKGVAAALSVGEEEATISIRSIQDPETPAAERDFFTALPPFEPTLADSIGADALAYLGIGSPATSAEALIDRAATTAPDLFEGLKRFDRALGKRGGVDLESELLPALDGEAALTVQPKSTPAGSGLSPGVAPAPSVPYLGLIATGVDTDQALEDMAELQGPIAETVDPGSGQAPVFETSEIDGVDAQSLRLSPSVDLTYAAWGDDLVIGTSPDAVAGARSGDERLAESAKYQTAVDGLAESLSMLLYFNTRSLLDLGERLFLSADPSYATVAADLRTLEAGALGVTSTDSELDTDLRVVIGEPVEAESELPPIELGGGD